MGKIKRYRNRVERFLASDRGQSFFNFAYSIGAAIVIWGALFKILELPGGNLLLTIGMGTEVVMFILTAFDRPPREYRWEDVFPVLDSQRDADAVPRRVDVPGTENAPVAVQASLPEVPKTVAVDSDEVKRLADDYLEQMRSLTRNIAGLNAIYELQLKSAGSQLDTADRVRQGMADMREMCERSSEISRRYREEAEKMTEHMQQLNTIYEKMLTAMTANPMAQVPPTR